MDDWVNGWGRRRRARNRDRSRTALQWDPECALCTECACDASRAEHFGAVGGTKSPSPVS